MTPKFWAFRKWKLMWWWTESLYSWGIELISFRYSAPVSIPRNKIDRFDWFYTSPVVSEILHLRFTKAAVSNGINSSFHSVGGSIPTPYPTPNFHLLRTQFGNRANLIPPPKSVEATFLNDPFWCKNTPKKQALNGSHTEQILQLLLQIFGCRCHCLAKLFLNLPLRKESSHRSGQQKILRM